MLKWAHMAILTRLGEALAELRISTRLGEALAELRISTRLGEALAELRLSTRLGEALNVSNKIGGGYDHLADSLIICLSGEKIPNFGEIAYLMSISEVRRYRYT